MTEPKSKLFIKKLTKWIVIIFAGFLLFQLFRLIFIMLFLGGSNPL
tara:strand:- start:472 stop:609 length:138 start_codon:yes stop_codon:yes gene_type:complete